MNCHTAQLLLSELGEAFAGRPEMLEAAAHAHAHVQSCDACRQYLADVAAMAAALQTPEEAIEPPQGGFDAFSARLARAGRHTPRRAFVRLAAAAGVGLAVTASFFAGRAAKLDTPAMAPVVPGNIASVPVAIDPQFVLSPAEVHASSRAFTAVSAAFDRRANWVWTGDSLSDVGVGQTTIGPQQSVLLLKLVMRSAGRVVCRGDLAIVVGRDAELTLPLNDGNRVHYRISAGDAADRINLVAELLDPHGSLKPLAALSTQLRTRSGEATRAGEMSTVAGNYELIAGFAVAPQSAQTGAAQ